MAEALGCACRFAMLWDLAGRNIRPCSSKRKSLFLVEYFFFVLFSGASLCSAVDMGDIDSI